MPTCLSTINAASGFYIGFMWVPVCRILGVGGVRVILDHFYSFRRAYESANHEVSYAGRHDRYGFAADGLTQIYLKDSHVTPGVSNK